MADALTLRLGRGSLSVPWNALDRAIQSVAPQWGARRLQARVGHELTAQLGGYNGASVSRRSLAGWASPAGDADAMVLPELAELRNRTRDLGRNSPVAAGAVNTTVTKVVGSGLSLMATPDADYLKLEDAELDAWQQDVERKFNAWWESTDCDITRHQSGYGLQDLVLRSECESGDVFVLLTRAQWSRAPVRLALQVVEADRVCNPDRRPDSARMVAGVSIDEQGAPLQYHIASGNPQRRTGAQAQTRLTWRTVSAFGSVSGRRNVLHIFQRRRPGQTRGVPMLAPVIEPLKQLERYTEAELMAAVVSGMFTVFVKAQGPSQVMPSALSGSGSTDTASKSGAAWDGRLGNGLVVDLGLNESIESVNPGRPNSQFDPFVQAIIRQIGLVLEIPYEVLVKHYSSSYSAARAALLDAWGWFKVRRSRLGEQLCQPVYEAWLDEAVASGYVRARGYFADQLTRRAWQGSIWVGDGPGAIDPVKEVDAAQRRVDLTISTHEAESLLHDGGRHRNKLRQLAREQTLRRDVFKLDPAPPRPGAPAAEPAVEPQT